MGGKQSITRRLEAHESNNACVSPIGALNIPDERKRLANRVCLFPGSKYIIAKEFSTVAIMAKSEARHAPYPYPRNHSLFVLHPTSQPAIPIRERPIPGTFRPPLNRAIPPIPESRSNESLRTISSVSASNSKHSISLEAKTPTDAQKQIVGIGTLLTSTKEEDPVSVVKETKEPVLDVKTFQNATVIENPMIREEALGHGTRIVSPTTAAPVAAVSKTVSQIPPPAIVYRPAGSGIPVKQAKSPITRVYAKVKNKIASKGRVDDSPKESPREEEPNKNLEEEQEPKRGRKGIFGSIRIRREPREKSRTRTVSESVSETVLCESAQRKKSNNSSGLSSPTKFLASKLHKTRSCDETFRSSSLKGKKGKEMEKPSIPSESSSQKTMTNASSATMTPSPVVKSRAVPLNQDVITSKLLIDAPKPGFLDQSNNNNSNTGPGLPLTRPKLLNVTLGGGKGGLFPDGAPLAESESSTVENSPAVEIPPDILLGHYPPGKKPPWFIRKGQMPKSPLVEDYKQLSLTPQPPAPISKLACTADIKIPSTVDTAHSSNNKNPKIPPEVPPKPKIVPSRIPSGIPQPAATYSSSRPTGGRYYSAQQKNFYQNLSARREKETHCSFSPPSTVQQQRNEPRDNSDSTEPSSTTSKILKGEAFTGVNPIVARRLQFAERAKPKEFREMAPAKQHKPSSSWTTTTTQLEDVVCKENSHSQDELLIVSPVKSNPRSSNPSPGTSPSKNERQDSGVKVSGGESSASSLTDSNTSKVTSPGSEYRGLIDDEIRDQPELIGSTSNDPPNQAGIENQERKEDSEKKEKDCKEEEEEGKDVVGPVRRTGSYKKKSVMRDSLISTTSIDSEDCMLDYENVMTVSMEGEDEVVVGGDTSSLIMKTSWSARRSQRSSISSDSTLVKSPSKRHSMEVSLDELSAMQTLYSPEHKKPNTPTPTKPERSGQSQKETIHSSPSTSEGYGSERREGRWSRSSKGSGLPILKPPPPMSQESMGQQPITVDAHVYRSMVQDITVLKTLLHRLKGELQKTETTNPFRRGVGGGGGEEKDGNSSVANGNVQTGAGTGNMLEISEELTSTDNGNLSLENIELRDQVASLKQQLSERDAMIRRLQMQLQRNSNPSSPTNITPPLLNGNRSPQSKSIRTDV